MMQLEWQTVVALVIVAATLTLFIVRLAKPKSKGGNCGHSCGCGKKAASEHPH
jgi:hypothetical protein